MKRSKELVGLSQEHQGALMLARKALRAVEACEVPAGSPEAADSAPTSAALDMVWQEIRQRFQAELEPHFQIEEQFLAPPLLERGERRLVERFEQDHARLRALIADESRPLLVKVRDFAELLERHVRFEERELFEVAQKVLSEEQLQRVARAGQGRRSGL